MPARAEMRGKVEERVAALETNVSSLARSVESLAQSVQTGFSDTRRERTELHGENQRSLRSLQDRLNENQRTPWATLAGWAAVVIAIVFGVGNVVAGGIQRSSDYHAGRLDDLDRTRLEAAYQRGALEAHLAAIDAAQDELRLSTRRLDERLQAEVGAVRGLQSK